MKPEKPETGISKFDSWCGDFFIMEKVKKIGKGFDRIVEGVVIIIYLIPFILVVVDMIYGGKDFLDETIARYLITITFTLAGFTFLVFWSNKKNEKFEFWVANSSFGFVSAGVFLLAFVLISNTTKKSLILEFLKMINPFLGILGFAIFLLSLSILVFCLYVETRRKKYK